MSIEKDLKNVQTRAQHLEMVSIKKPEAQEEQEEDDLHGWDNDPAPSQNQEREASNKEQSQQKKEGKGKSWLSKVYNKLFGSAEKPETKAIEEVSIQEKPGIQAEQQALVEKESDKEPQAPAQNQEQLKTQVQTVEDSEEYKKLIEQEAALKQQVEKWKTLIGPLTALAVAVFGPLGGAAVGLYLTVENTKRQEDLKTIGDKIVEKKAKFPVEQQGKSKETQEKTKEQKKERKKEKEHRKEKNREREHEKDKILDQQLNTQDLKNLIENELASFKKMIGKQAKEIQSLKQVVEKQQQKMEEQNTQKNKDVVADKKAEQSVSKNELDESNLDKMSLKERLELYRKQAKQKKQQQKAQKQQAHKGEPDKEQPNVKVKAGQGQQPEVIAQKNVLAKQPIVSKGNSKNGDKDWHPLKDTMDDMKKEDKSKQASKKVLDKNTLVGLLEAMVNVMPSHQAPQKAQQQGQGYEGKAR